MNNCQFWTVTSVQIASVVTTLILGALAIWGESIRARWVGPKLTLGLLDPQGERIGIGSPHGTPSRWYHLRVTNQRRSAPAKNVRVVLVKVSRPSADGQIRPTALSGPVQIGWQHGNFMPQYPTLGPALNADLGFVTGGGFQLTPIFTPNNLNITLQAGERMVVEALAISDETESSSLCVEVSWDGTWAEDAAEMSRHLVVKEVKCL
jgi:hypothetical protein